MAYTRASSTWFPWQDKWTQVTHQGVKTQGNRQNIMKRYDTARTGTKVDSYKDKIQKGLNATSAFSTVARRVDDVNPGSTRMTFTHPGIPTPWVITEEGFAFDTADVAHIPISAAAVQNEALMKIIKKVRAERSHLNGLAFTGELREAIHGLRHPFELLRSQVYSHTNKLNNAKLALRNMPEKSRKKAWREVISGTWLETSFGLRPIISDTKEIAEALSRFQFELPKKVRLQSKSAVSNATVSTGQTGFGDQYLQFRTVFKRESTAFCSYSVGMSSETRPAGSVSSLIEVLGFTPENFVPALYEVMPWSWLIDYFSNVGNIIEAGTTSHVGIKWISRSVGVKTIDTYLAVPSRELTQNLMGQAKINTWSGSPSSATLSMATLDRTNPPTLGIPDLTFTIPGRGVQIANLIAIMGQLSGRPYDPSVARKILPPSLTRKSGVRRASDFQNLSD